MPEISFALILSENLKNKKLKVKQVESVIEVKGKLDAYQLQKIRDSVEDSFKARRKTINDLIAGKAKEAEKASPLQRKKIIAEVDAAIAKSTAAFDKKIQGSITDFCKKDAELEKAATAGKWSYWCNTAWDVGSLMWNASEAAAETGGALATGGATALLALKSLADLCLDFEKLCRTQADAWRSLEDQEDRLKAALDAIRKVKKGAGVPQSLIDKAESALAPLGPKIDVVEKTTRSLAGKLDELLKKQDAKELKGRKAVKALNKTVQSTVENVSALGEGVALRRKAQKSAKDSIKSATTKAVSDPWSYVTWARGIYEDFNDMMDMNKKSEGLYDDAKKLKIMVDKMIDDGDDD